MFLFRSLLLVAVAFTAACTRTPPANVAAMVNGRAITYSDLEKRFQSEFATPTEHPSDDQVSIQRLEILRTLVDEEILVQRAERMGLMAVDSDVEAKFSELKAPYTQEEFQKHRPVVRQVLLEMVDLVIAPPPQLVAGLFEQ